MTEMINKKPGELYQQGKVRRIVMMPWLLAAILRGQTFVAKGLPDDAFCYSVGADFSIHGITLYIVSETFSPVPYGEATPQLVDVTLETIEDVKPNGINFREWL